MRRISQARLNIFSSSYFVSFTATGRLRGLCRVKRFAPGKTLKSAEFSSDDLSPIKGLPRDLSRGNMKEAAKMLEFEYAAVLRDRIIELRGEK